MWTFKKKTPVKQEPDNRMALIQQLEEWRGVGESFQYLGRELVVIGHWQLRGGYPYGQFVSPSISADYADDLGVIRRIEFSASESAALMMRQPNP